MKRFLGLSLVALLFAGAVRAEPLGNSTCDGGAGTLSADIFTAYVNDTSRNGFSLDGGSALADGGPLLSAKKQANICSQVYNYAQYLGVSDAGTSSAQTYDVDFTSLTTATLPMNSTVTIDGKTWQTVDTNGTPGTSFQITNGTGLTIANTTQDVGYLHANLPDLIPGSVAFANVTEMEVWYYLNVNVIGASYSATLSGVSGPDENGGTYAGSTGDGIGALFGKSYTGYYLITTQYGGNSNSTTSNLANTASDNVIVLRVFFGSWWVEVLSGVYSSGWPSLTALKLQGVAHMNGDYTTFISTNKLPVIAQFGPFMEVQSFGTPYTSTTYKRMKVVVR